MECTSIYCYVFMFHVEYRQTHSVIETKISHLFSLRKKNLFAGLPAASVDDV